MACLGTDVRDRNSLNTMADAIDIQPDLVTDRDIPDGRHLDVDRAGERVRGQVGLRARLPDRTNRGYFVLLNVSCHGRVGCTIPERNLLADSKAIHAHHRYIRRSGWERDHWTVGQRLPDCRMVAGR